VKRSTPLKRTGRVKAKRSTPRRSSREHDQKYMARVRELYCLCTDFIFRSGMYDDCHRGCSARDTMHAHHMGARGLGQKCTDYETVPFCERHHRDWHDCTGPFEGKSKEWRREFAQAAIEDTQSKLGRLK
jgi:hypothetical protein